MPSPFAIETVVPRAPLVDALCDELLAIPERELLLVNIDVAAAALSVLGAIPDIHALSPDLAALCGESMASAVDRLELVASTCLQAQAALQASESALDLAQLSLDVVAHRDGLSAEVRSLIARKHLPAGCLDSVLSARGFRNQCMDLMQLTQLLLSHWDTVGPRVGVSLDEVHAAEAAAGRLAKAVGVRNQVSQSPAPKMRQRAFTLMASTWDDTRRMISFLRWKQGDSDVIAPSLYTVRSKPRRRKESTVPEVVSEPVAAPPAAAPSPIAPSIDEPGAPVSQRVKKIDRRRRARELSEP